MIKLVCPGCGWSDFLKYDCDDYWTCQCCGMQFEEVKSMETDVPKSEYDGYGVTYIDKDKDDYYDDFTANYETHFAKYMKNCSNLGSNGTTEEPGIFPSSRYGDFDGFSILHLKPDDTGLPYELVINTLGTLEDDSPMIGIVVGESVIFVSVAKQPENLSHINFPGQEKIFRWISKHRERLEKHWNKEMTDRELLNSFFNDVREDFPSEEEM